MSAVAVIAAAAAVMVSHAQVGAGLSDVDRYLVVDCLLPPQRIAIGNRLRVPGPRRAIKATADECGIRGGQFVEYDRASYDTARGVWLGPAERGDADAQNYLGEIYERGLGVEPDYAAAREWYERAAEQGHAGAQFNLGKLYETGLGVPVDPDQALFWYRRASGLPDLVEAPELAPAAPGSGATDAPVIEIIDPIVPETRGVTVTNVAADVSERVIVGRVRAADAIRSVTINDREIPLTTSADSEEANIFQTRVAVPRTGTRVTIVAVDAAGRSGRREFLLQPTSGTTGRRGPNFGHYHALVIGNDAYQYMNPLTTAVNDAMSVADVLRDRYGFEVSTLTNVTRAEIMTAINALTSALTEEDNLLIYYAGHGTLDEVNDRGHWLPVNARPDDTTEWLSNQSLTDLLAIMKARHVLVVSDSCYSGALTRSVATALRSGQSDADLRALLGKRSRTALASGGIAPVLDRGERGHSVFANAFIDVLRQNSGVIEVQRLYLQIRERVASAAFDRARFEQVPVYAPINQAGHEFGEFFFVPTSDLRVALDLSP